MNTPTLLNTNVTVCLAAFSVFTTSTLQAATFDASPSVANLGTQSSVFGTAGHNRDWQYTSSIAADSNAELLRLLKKLFPEAPITTEMFVDPDEGWEAQVVRVGNVFSEFEAQIEAEERFYSAVMSDSGLERQLRAITVVFD